MEDVLSRYLTSEERRLVRAPIETARTLPRQAFCDAGFHELEAEAIYGRNWVAVGYAQDAQAAGDAFCVDVCGVPLFLLRGDDGTLRAFHNICPYDGCPVLLEDASGLAEIEVSYHGWRYDLRGRLTAIPYWAGPEETALSALGGRAGDLATVSCETWGGLVFVHLGPAPRPFEQYIHPVEKLTEELGMECLSPMQAADGSMATLCERVGANWKTYFENACVNILHENFVHGLYRASPEVPRVDADGKPRFTLVDDDGLLGFRFRDEDFRQTYGVPEGLPHIGPSPERRPEHGFFATCYPNFYLAGHPVYLELGFALPDGPEATVGHRFFLLHPDLASGAEAAAFRAAIQEGFAEAGREDARIIEAVQRGRRSPAFSQKFYAPAWDHLHWRLNNLVLDDLERATETQGDAE